MTLAQIIQQSATILRQPVTALTANTINDPATPTAIDIALPALNMVRTAAEQDNDFEFSRQIVEVQVTPPFTTPLSSAIVTGQAVVTGTLSPNAVGTYFANGLQGGIWVYRFGAYQIFYGAGKWILGTTADGFSPTNYWYLTTTNSVYPWGTYTAAGSNTGAPVIAAIPVEIKTILDCGLYDIQGNLRPVEWTSEGESLERQRQENLHWTPRYPDDAWAQIGPWGRFRFVFSGGPRGQVGSYPIPNPTAQNCTYRLGITCYVKTIDWTDETKTYDPWTTQGAQWLTWALVCELNPVFKTFVPREEGNLGEPTDKMNAALNRFKEWDVQFFEAHRRHGR